MLESLFEFGNQRFRAERRDGRAADTLCRDAPEVRGGDYIGPDGIAEMWGNPARAKRSAPAQDKGVAARLWIVSEQMTGVHFDALPA